jgi:hypothetical protein
MSIELRSQVVAPERRTHEPLSVKEITFESRKATFVVRSDNYAFAGDWGVMFRVGPLGVNLQADEAEALGKALIECAEYYRAALARAGGGA